MKLLCSLWADLSFHNIFFLHLLSTYKHHQVFSITPNLVLYYLYAGVDDESHPIPAPAPQLSSHIFRAVFMYHSHRWHVTSLVLLRLFISYFPSFHNPPRFLSVFSLGYKFCFSQLFCLHQSAVTSPLHSSSKP